MRTKILDLLLDALVPKKDLGEPFEKTGDKGLRFRVVARELKSYTTHNGVLINICKQLGLLTIVIINAVARPPWLAGRGAQQMDHGM